MRCFSMVPLVASSASCMGDVVLPPSADPPGVEILFIDVGGQTSVFVSDLSDPIPIPLELRASDDVIVESIVYPRAVLGMFGLEAGPMALRGEGPLLPRFGRTGHQFRDGEWSVGSGEGEGDSIGGLRVATDLRAETAGVCVPGPECPSLEPSPPMIDPLSRWCEHPSPVACAPAQRATISGSCAPVGTACPPAGDFTGDADFYVRIGSDGDGSAGSPFGSIDRAIDEAGSRTATIALAAGSYVALRPVRQGLLVRGACPADVRFEVGDPVEGVLDNLTITDVTSLANGGRITNAVINASVANSTGVATLEDVAFSGPIVSIGGSLVARRVGIATIFADRRTVRVEESVVRFEGPEPLGRVEAVSSIVQGPLRATEAFIAGATVDGSVTIGRGRLSTSVVHGRVAASAIELEDVLITGTGSVGLSLVETSTAAGLEVSGFDVAIEIVLSIREPTLRMSRARLRPRAVGIDIPGRATLSTSALEILGRADLSPIGIRSRGPIFARDLLLDVLHGIDSSGPLDLERASITGGKGILARSATAQATVHLADVEVIGRGTRADAAIELQNAISPDGGPVLSRFAIRAWPGIGIQATGVTPRTIIAREGVLDASIGVELEEEEDVSAYERLRVDGHGEMLVIGE